MHFPTAPIYLAASLLLAVTLLAGPAAAHQTWYSPDNKVKFVYGNLNEPVYTFQKTGLDVGFFDNATSGPIPNLAAAEGQTPGAVGFRIWLVYSGQELELTQGLRAQFGKPGWVTYPYMLTRPGAYSVRIEGAINGTQLNLTIPPKHDILPLDSIMWPAKFPTADNESAQVDALKAEVALLKADVANLKVKGRDGGAAPGFELAGLALLAILGAWTYARRRP